jgi:uncharacterized membrane protein YeaQ/YmgE (transglycosylase-associated protein family)
MTFITFLGPFCFGLVIGWVTYRTLRRKAEGVALGDIAAVIGAVGGATVVGLFKAAGFDSYCFGLAVGFFAYFISGIIIEKKGKTDGQSVGGWMGSRDSQ